MSDNQTTKNKSGSNERPNTNQVPTKRIQYESKFVVEEEGRRATQNIQISSTITSSSEQNDPAQSSQSANVVTETWISNEDNSLSDIETTTYLHLNLLTELARSNWIGRKRQMAQEDSKQNKGSNRSATEESDNNQKLKKARYSWQVKNMSDANVNENACTSDSKSQTSSDSKTPNPEEIKNNFKEGMISSRLEHKRKISLDKSEESDSKKPNSSCITSESESLEKIKCGKTSSHTSVSSTSSIVNVSTTTPCVDVQSDQTNRVSITNLPCTNSTSSDTLNNNSQSKNTTSITNNSESHKSEGNSETPSATSTNSARTSRSRNRERTYLQKWQHQHVAKSIVDNALNTTLEVLGFSPNAHRSRRVANQRRRVEDEAVSAAIQSKGLHNPETEHAESETPSSSTSTQQNAEQDVTLDPVINHLTQFSEDIFVRNLQPGNRTQSNSSDDGADSTDDELSHNTSNESLKNNEENNMIFCKPGTHCFPNYREDNNTNYSQNQQSITLENSGVCENTEPSSSDVSEIVNSPKDDKGIKNSSNANKKSPESNLKGTTLNEIDCLSSGIDNSGYSVESREKNSNLDSDDIDLLGDQNSLQSDVLNQAVAAAICTKGLGFEPL